MAINHMELPWLCVECGYSCNAATSPINPTRPPVDDDLTICMNCGHLYIRRADKWAEPTPRDLLEIPPKVFEVIFAMRRAREAVVKDDLAKRGRPH